MAFYLLSNLFLTRHLEQAQYLQWAGRSLQTLKTFTDIIAFHITQKLCLLSMVQAIPTLPLSSCRLADSCCFTAHHLPSQDTKDTKPHSHGGIPHIALAQARRQKWGKSASLLDRLRINGCLTHRWKLLEGYHWYIGWGSPHMSYLQRAPLTATALWMASARMSGSFGWIFHSTSSPLFSGAPLALWACALKSDGYFEGFFPTLLVWLFHTFIFWPLCKSNCHWDLQELFSMAVNSLYCFPSGKKKKKIEVILLL